MLATATMMLAMLMGLPAPLLDDPSRGVAAGGVWELGGTYDVAMPIRFLASAASEDANIAVVSDLRGAVAGVRVDSGMVAWTRKLDGLRGVWVIGTTVVAAGREVAAFRADVGTRLWSRDLGCPADPSTPCEARVLAVDAHGVWLAEGGAVQTALVRLDVESGAPKWARTAAVAHARALVSGAGWVAAAEGESPFTVRFFDVDGGRELGQWTRRIGGVARPVGQLVTNPAGRALYALDLRPGDGRLAHVIVVGSDGVEQTTRVIARDPTVRNQAVWAAASDDALALFVPDPAAGGAQLVAMGLSEPFSASTTALPSWSEPLVVGDRIIVPPPPPGDAAASNSAPASLWTAWQAGQSDSVWSRRIEGLGPSSKTFAVGARLVLVDPDGADLGVVTLAAADGTVLGIGTAALGSAQAPVSGATFVNDALVVARGQTLARLVHLPTAEVRARLKRGAEAGGDVGPILRRLGRFGALADGLVDPALPVPGEALVRGGAGGLSAADVALLGAFREAWAGDPKGALEGLVDVIDRSEATPAGLARKVALLEGMSRLALGEVLATGAVPRDDDAKSALVGLARSFDAAAKPGTTSAIALWGALAARLDEPLLAADVLAHARSAATADPLVEPAYLEVARRATRQIRVSAGALATSTQRDMLVAGLRFFRHLDAVLGPSSDRAAELMDQAGASPAAARELAQLLAANEGSAASQKSALGPATCELACDAAARLCPNEVDRPTCQVRCARTGVVRFVDRARPLASEARETWFCGQ